MKDLETELENLVTQTLWELFGEASMIADIPTGDIRPDIAWHVSRITTDLTGLLKTYINDNTKKEED